MSELDGDPQVVSRLSEQFLEAVARLERTSGFAKGTNIGPVLELGCRLLAQPGGVPFLYQHIERVEQAGTFVGSDWEHPETLQPRLATGTMAHGERSTATLEMLSELRLLAVAQGDYFHLKISAENARHFLAQVLALGLEHLFGGGTEASRHGGVQVAAVQNLLAHIAERIGYGHVLDNLIGEIERILAQRPIMVDHVKTMITQVAACANDPDLGGSTPSQGINRLVSALYGPSAACREDPGTGVYAERLSTLDEEALRREARELALAMHSTGLVSPYHAVFLHHVNGSSQDLVAQCLGLSRTGADAYSCYSELITELISVAVTPHTSQTVYGLALMLERGMLFNPAVSPALWGQIALQPSVQAQQVLAHGFGAEPPASTLLLAGIINVLGQPLGIGQGNNPTCQAARAISMWALATPDYLLRLLTRAARDDEIMMYFEGRRLSSADVAAGSLTAPPLDVDPVSMLLVPHLDRIYIEMGRLCADREGDPHAWINREMHGWWVGRDTALAVDIASGELTDYEAFVRRFYALYHPVYNRNRPVVHPQPAGIAVTDSLGRFIGWHAISVLRVGLGPGGGTRVYFFNPNNDSGQDWGQGIVVSTEGNGERFGESSLPIAEFSSRLYLYHWDPCDEGDAAAVPADELVAIETMARASWAADR